MYFLFSSSSSLLSLFLSCFLGKLHFSRVVRKEFHNVGGDQDRHGNSFSSPTSQEGADVYFLPLTEVSLPLAEQPLLTPTTVPVVQWADVGLHRLVFLSEMGRGRFGKVFLGEVSTATGVSQVVVKELQHRASVQEHIHFLEEARPFRSLRHPSLLRCFSERPAGDPHLIIMEFCPLGDVKSFLRRMTVAPEWAVLQRMADDITAGVEHLHTHNYTHSDLALRNVMLASNLSVKIGDYGLSHTNFKEDYYVTADQLLVPLRWIAPELLDEVHGNLLVASQSRTANIWSLGVTLWELFKSGEQPYRNFSDQQVLTFAVRERRPLTLPRPPLPGPLADRWFEILQFCWLRPHQRPTATELHLLLSYLRAKGASEVEEDFERRWNSLRPSCGTPPLSHTPSSLDASSFSCYHPGDDVLTITETSGGLNFECQWERAKAESYADAIFPSASPLPYASDPSRDPHSPSLANFADNFPYSPAPAGIDAASYWSTDFLMSSTESSPAISCATEPLLIASAATTPRPWESSHYVSYKDRDGGYYYDPSSPLAKNEFDSDYYYDPSPPPPLAKDISDGDYCFNLLSPLAKNVSNSGYYRNPSPSPLAINVSDDGYRYNPSQLPLDMFLARGEESWGSRSLRRALGELDDVVVAGDRHTVSSLRNAAPVSVGMTLFLADKSQDAFCQIGAKNECFSDPLTATQIGNKHYCYASDEAIGAPSDQEVINLSPAPGGPAVAKMKNPTSNLPVKEKGEELKEEKKEEEVLNMSGKATLPSSPPPADNFHVMVAPDNEDFTDSKIANVSLADILDCTDEEEEEEEEGEEPGKVVLEGEGKGLAHGDSAYFSDGEKVEEEKEAGLNSDLGEWAAEVVGAMEAVLKKGAEPGKATPPKDEVARRRHVVEEEGEEEEVGDEEEFEREEEEERDVEVVSEEVKNLRGVLRASEEREGKEEKTVSFFDDVIIYMFDQESPSQDLLPCPPDQEGGATGSQSEARISADSNFDLEEEEKKDEKEEEERRRGNGGEERRRRGVVDQWDDELLLPPLPTSSSSSRFTITQVEDKDTAAGSHECGDEA